MLNDKCEDDEVLDKADVPVFIPCMPVARAILVVAKSAVLLASTGIFHGCVTTIPGTPNEVFPRSDIVAIMGRLAGNMASRQQPHGFCMGRIRIRRALLCCRVEEIAHHLQQFESVTSRQ